MKGKIIVIEGTDCSGKQTQAELLVKKLNKNGYKTIGLSFPMYDTPTGKIIGGPYLGKSYIGEGYFSEGASNVNPKVACLYFAADRLYNIDKINRAINSGINVILDRYVESNMCHQGGKIKDINKRNELIDWIDNLEFGFLKLPRPDKVIFLYMPYKKTIELKRNREELPDQHECDENYLINAENTYIYLSNKYKYITINCVNNEQIKSIDDISKEVYNNVLNYLKEGK